MRRPSALPALCVALLLVVAGCAAPAGPGPTTAGPDADPRETPATAVEPTPGGDPETTAGGQTTPTDTEATPDPVDPVDVPVEGGSLPVDVGRIYARVQRMTDLTAEGPTVTVEDPRDRPVTPETEPFLEALGIAGGSIDDADCGIAASASASGDRVRIVPDDLSPAEIELVLAHEFVHVLQRNNDLRARTDQPGREGRSVRLALIEGAAVYVADEYAERYDLTWNDGDTPLDVRRCYWETVPDGLRGLAAVYHFGGLYFEGAVDDPRDLAAAYEDLPNTTEGVLHGEPAGEDPPAPLSVDADAGDWQVTQRGAYGELYTRIVLASRLSESRAASAAEGWGADRALSFERGDRTGFAWIHVWDDPAEAAEFRDAAAAFAAAMTDGPPVRVVRVDPETTALLFGDESFVEAASVAVEDGTVTVTVEEGAADQSSIRIEERTYVSTASAIGGPSSRSPTLQRAAVPSWAAISSRVIASGSASR